MQQHPLAPPPPPPPPPPTSLLSPDGRYAWNGTGWIPRAPVPWQLTTARILVFVESGLLGLMGLILLLAIGTIGVFVNADNGGAGLPQIGRAMLVVLGITAVVMAAVIVLGVKMIRRRWAYRTIAAFQALLAVGTVVSVASYASSTKWTTTNIVIAVVEVLYPLVTLALLVAPRSRRAVLTVRADG